jgi:hypothetical protein
MTARHWINTPHENQPNCNLAISLKQRGIGKYGSISKLLANKRQIIKSQQRIEEYLVWISDKPNSPDEGTQSWSLLNYHQAEYGFENPIFK